MALMMAEKRVDCWVVNWVEKMVAWKALTTVAMKALYWVANWVVSLV